MRIFILTLIIVIANTTLFAQQTKEQKIDSLRQIINSTTSSDSNTLAAMGRLQFLWSNDEQDSAHYYLSRYKKLAYKNQSQFHIAGAAGYESKLFLYEGNYAPAILAAKKRIQVGENIKNYYIASGGCSDLGNVFQKLGELDTALVCYQQGYAYAKADTNELAMSRSLINISETYKLKGAFVKALKVGQEAMELCLKNSYRGYYASIYNLLGEIYMEVKDYQRAKKEFKKAIAVSLEESNKNKLSIAYELLAKCQIQLKEYQQAENNLKLSIKLGEISKMNIIEGRALWKLAELYHLQSQDSRALATIEKSEVLLLKNNDKLELISAYQIKGDILNALKKYPQAKETCWNAYQLNLGAKQKSNEMEICYCLYNAYKGTNEMTLAIQQLEKYLSLKDSLMNYAISREITQLEDQKVYDQKVFSDSLERVNQLAAQNLAHDKETAQQQNVLIIAISVGVLILLTLIFVGLLYISNKRKKQLIEESLGEKEILLKEIHHRVKNNLQIISGLLELQSNSLSDNNATTALLEGQARVKSMALIHQKLYQTDNLAIVDMLDYATELTNYLQSLYRKGEAITLRFDIENIKLDIDTAIPLGLILNELITNAFKYAFEAVAQPLITISIVPVKTGEYRLGFADNGKGLKDDFDLKKSKSLGLKLVKRLVQQLFGKIEIKNEQGLKINIIFQDSNLRKMVE